MRLFDRLQLTTEREYTSEGFLKVPARISRTGIQEYLAIELGLTDREPSDKIFVFRPEEEVFSEESLQSFSTKPITNNHPPELINAENCKRYSVGMSSKDVFRDGDFVKTDLIITDASSIKDVESGKIELSNGYTADIEWTEGVTSDGIKYDAVQRNIRGNHIAIVERGRAGPSCRLADTSPTIGENRMKKVIIDGVEYEVSDQVAQAVDKLQKKLTDAEEEVAKKEEELEKKDEELEKKEDEMEEVEKESKKTEDSLKAKIDDLKGKIPSQKTIDKMVSDRIALVESVKKVCPEMVIDGKSASDLMKEVVASKCPTVQMDSVSTDYIKARFDMLVESFDDNSQFHLDNALSKQVTNNDQQVTDHRPAHVIAREKMIENARNAWKKTGGAK